MGGQVEAYGSLWRLEVMALRTRSVRFFRLTMAMSTRLCTSGPLGSGLGLSLVDPGLVDVHRVGPDAEGPVLQDILQRWAQDVPQGAMTTSLTVEVHQHPDDSWVSCDHVLRAIDLQSDRGVGGESVTSLCEQLQQQKSFSVVGAVVKETEDQHLQEGGGARYRKQEEELGQRCSVPDQQADLQVHQVQVGLQLSVEADAPDNLLPQTQKLRLLSDVTVTQVEQMNKFSDHRQG
ncbi:hypothetical protein INR49_019679, partial [Caranx melampygus]